MQYCPTYYDAIAMQKRLKALSLSEIKPESAAQCCRAWLELEWFKREVRGKPRLKALDMRELVRDITPRQRAILTAPLELEPTETKESLSPETVTAPPPAKPPSAIE